MNISSLKKSKVILAAMLYGSTARKDSDAYSDKDIFILCDDMNAHELLKIKKNLIAPAFADQMSVSTYRLNDVIAMSKKNSLFMWHLKLQGKIIFSKNRILDQILETLEPYNNYQEDLECYTKLLADVKNSLTKWGYLNEFDISLLFTIARNICILLCYHQGAPKFGRSNAYLKANRIFRDNFPMPDKVYQKLCSYKIWYERGIKMNRDSNNEFNSNTIIDHMNDLLSFAKGICL